jgi:predicted nucleotide-binding protein
MIERFAGKENFSRLLNALRQQQTVYSDELATEIAQKVRLCEFKQNDLLIRQGESDDDVFFILAGRVSIQVNGREIAIRRAGQHVGEMALIDPSARRSATVCALEPVVAAKLNESQFTAIADRFPRCWRLVALELSARLRQRDRFIKTPNPRPVLFIGSSKESLPVATAVRTRIESDDVIVRLWTDGVFGASKFPIEDLETQVQTSDFAVLVMAPDDKVISRKIESGAPRDNAVFELGLYGSIVPKSHISPDSKRGRGEDSFRSSWINTVVLQSRRRRSVVTCFNTGLRRIEQDHQKTRTKVTV